jgi:hypothetical protein
MGHTIWVETRGQSKDEPRRDHSIMLRLQDPLDALSTNLGVVKLTVFYDYGELLAAYGEFDDEGVEPEGEDLPAEDGQSGGSWYDPGAALAAVRAIHVHLLQNPEGLGFVADPSRAHWPGALMEELSHCESVLREAVARGQQFRFLIVP